MESSSGSRPDLDTMLRPWSSLPVPQRIPMLVLAVWLPAAASEKIYCDFFNLHE